MALRDPGEPRRNPLFPVDDPWVGDRRADDPYDDSFDDGFGPRDPSEGPDPLRGAPGNAVGPLLAALQDAGPEAAEHLVNAAHELTLAIKVVVDAVERSLAEQRDALASDAGRAAPPRPTEREPRVRRIDLDSE